MVGWVSRTALFWNALCCVLLSDLVAGGHAPPGNLKIEELSYLGEEEHQQPFDLPGLAQGQVNPRRVPEPKLVTKREAVTPDCPVVESPVGSGLQKVKEIDLLEYSFYMEPQPGFRALEFRMKIDNLLNGKGPYVTDEKIVFRGSDLESYNVNTWIKVEVKYYKHIVRWGRDKHGLTVTVGNWSRSVRSSPWWRTHSFEGFVLLVGGPAKLMFNCLPGAAAEQIPSVQLLYKPILLGCVLGGAFPLVVAAFVCLIISRRGRPRQDAPPPVPKLPKSLLLQRGQRSDPDANYDEFDEDTLLRLRQQLDPETFACFNASSAYKHDGSKDGQGDGTNSSIFYRDEEASKFSLLEEKQKAWLQDPSGPAPEPQYVEMHGILNKNSNLK